MRSPGVIYRRYRQIKKKILYDTLEKAKLCRHENCHYGKEVQYTDVFHMEHSLKVCNYTSLLSEGRIEVCTNPLECNAFVNKWNKNKVVEAVDSALSDPDLKRKCHPELTIMEWVLDKDLNEAIKNPGFLGTIVVKGIEFLEGILRSR
jgi:hypothetical protein